MAKPIFIINKNWVRHGAYSGYELLSQYLDTPYTIVRGRELPHFLAFYFKTKTKLKNYRGLNVIKEFKLLLKLWSKKNIHILYADMDYYYLHYIKRFPFNLRKTTLIATFHHPPNELEIRMLYDRSRVLGALDKIIVMGPNQIPFFSRYTSAEIAFIPHGIDLNYFKPNPNLAKQRQFLVLGISHRDHERNISIINSFPRDLGCRFIVVMPKQYSKLYEHLDCVDLISKKITDAELLRYYQESMGLLLSLKDCTASNSILEALACGCPLIVNDVGAVNAYIPDSCGVPVFGTDEVNETLSYMVKLIENKSFAEEISRNQTELAKKYGWNLVAKATEDFILH